MFTEKEIKQIKDVMRSQMIARFPELGLIDMDNVHFDECYERLQRYEQNKRHKGRKKKKKIGFKRYKILNDKDPLDSILDKDIEHSFVSGKFRIAILHRDNFRCVCCGYGAGEIDIWGKIVKLDVDHIIPRSRGGTNHPNNLRSLCKRCNTGKWAYTMEELISVVK